MRADPRVKASSRRRIKEAAERLGYRPNLLARNLADGKTNTIWTIIPSLDATTDYRLVREVSHHSNNRNYSLFAALHDCDNFGSLEGHTDEHYAQIIEKAGQGLADGALILPRRHVNDTEILSDLVRHKYPMVFIDNYVEDLPVPVVTTDNVRGAHELARRCVDAGARQAVLLFEEANPVARTRLVGAETALLELGIPLSKGTNSLDTMLSSSMGSPLAIIGSSQYYVHRFVVQNARQLNGKPLIFGVFDDWTGEPAPAELVIIAVQNCETIAKHAIDRLIDIIEKKPFDYPRIELVPILEFKNLTGSFSYAL